jgi:hypothetical protein
MAVHRRAAVPFFLQDSPPRFIGGYSVLAGFSPATCVLAFTLSHRSFAAFRAIALRSFGGRIHDTRITSTKITEACGHAIAGSMSTTFEP